MRRYYIFQYMFLPEIRFLINDVFFLNQITLNGAIHKLILVISIQACDKGFLHIHHRQIMPYLQHIMSWNTLISPLIFRIIIAGFTFQNRKCPIRHTNKKSTSASMNGYNGCRNMTRTGNTSSPVFWKRFLPPDLPAGVRLPWQPSCFPLLPE